MLITRREQERFNGIGILFLREEQDGSLGTPVEVLPCSRRLWTKDGVPALWRKISGGR
jgi:hypothetical protein